MSSYLSLLGPVCILYDYFKSAIVLLLFRLKAANAEQKNFLFMYGQRCNIQNDVNVLKCKMNK